ncbi:MAG TPA: phosphodiester glycosidase family protein [Micromonosporaceae bacterium]
MTAATPGSSSQAAAAGWLPSTPQQWPVVVNETVGPSETITRGLTHHSESYETVGGAQRAQVLDADMTDSNLRLGVVEAHDHLTDPPDEVPTSMATRTGAVAGVNADFFEIYGTGRAEGMVDIDGTLDKSPAPDRPWDLWVRTDGSVGIGVETYAGTASIGAASRPIASVNTVSDLAKGGLERITPFLGDGGTIPASTIALGTPVAGGLTVTSVQTGVTDLTALAAGTDALVGAGGAGTWLAANAHAGDTVQLAESLSPDNDVRQAVSGGALLVQNGQMAVPLQGDGENNVDNPVTGVGVSKDGKKLIMVAFDGHQPEGVAQGLTRPQLAGWMMQQGAYNAILFDSGGSTQMVGRKAGDTAVSVLNVPSDGHERPVANGLFFYPTAPVGPAAHVTVPDLNALVGTDNPLHGYATDSRANPTGQDVSYRIEPSSLGTVTDGVFHATRAGTGVIRASAGAAHTVARIRVTPSLASLTVSPDQVDLANKATQQFTAAATDASGRAVDLPATAVTWSSDVGTLTPAGLFTAAAGGATLGTVTARVAGRTATSSVAVGQVTEAVDPVTDLSEWSASDAYMNVYPRPAGFRAGATSTSDGSISYAADQSPPGLTGGSIDAHYNYAAANKVYDFDVGLNDPDSKPIPLLNGTQAPTGIGVWVKGNADLAKTPGNALDPGIVSLNIGIWQATNQPTSFYPTGVTFDGWQFVVATLPPGLEFPLRVNYLGLVVIKPPTTMTGDVYLAGLTALYSPRPPTPFNYQALPNNPSWLKFTDPSQFRPGGTTIASMDDAHAHADDPDGTGPAVMRRIATDFTALPANAKPDEVQALGDMPDSGTATNLGFAKSLLDGLGVPYHDAVGNHEITQGADPETGNFTAAFGPTHYAYDEGPARVIVTDSAHIGITASDPFQVPSTDPPQYQWLVDQLSANTSKVAIVVTHVPAYDPHPRADSQFSDRYEAQMYEALIARYQRTHRGVHVLLLFGHARGFAENLIDSLPNFVVADAGSPPYAPTDQGGFYHYALFHVLPDGTVQFAVQPVLASVTVTAPAASLAVGAHETLTASGTSVTGDDASALTVPVADPISRRWSSSDPGIASVDPVSGVVTARHQGAVTITLATGDVTATAPITVTR